ncbi:MAG: NAD(+) synthase [Anaerolineaceae bacterium]|jgi:NAD+ synthase
MLNIKEGLYFDAAQAVNEIEQFIRSEVHRLGKRGVVLGLSGGLDSTTCAFLCVRALGRAHVLTYMLPERDTDAQNMADAELVANTLGLEVTHIDISPVLTTLGVYNLVSGKQAGDRRLIESGIRWITRLSSTPSAFSQGIAMLYGTKANIWLRLARRIFWKPLGRIHAFTITKVRQRMVTLYFHAMVNNCLVVGTTDRSEWSVGFYDPYGDGASDVQLLRHLYKTQIRELAKHLEVPARILNKPSSGDLAAGLPNESAIGLTYEQLDSILWGVNHGLTEKEIVSQTSVTLSAIASIQKAISLARLRESLPSMLPVLP